MPLTRFELKTAFPSFVELGFTMNPIKKIARGTKRIAKNPMKAWGHRVDAKGGYQKDWLTGQTNKIDRMNSVGNLAMAKSARGRLAHGPAAQQAALAAQKQMRTAAMPAFNPTRQMRSSLLRNSAKLEQIFLESARATDEPRPIPNSAYGGAAAALGGGLLVGRQYKRGKEAQAQAYKGIKKLNPFMKVREKDLIKSARTGKMGKRYTERGKDIVISRKTVKKRPAFDAPINTQTQKPFTTGSKAYRDALAANKAKPKAKVNKDKVIKAGKKQGKKLSKHLKGSFWKGARKLFERLDEFETIELARAPSWGKLQAIRAAKKKRVPRTWGRKLQKKKISGTRPFIDPNSAAGGIIQ